MNYDQIWKYQLAECSKQTVQMPRGAKFLSIALQYGRACVWMKVDSTQKFVPRDIIIAPTDRQDDAFIPSEDVADFMGTFADGTQVSHFFLVKENKTI